MTRDEIIDLACEHTVGGLEFDEEGLLRFVEIIAAAEREVIAKMIEDAPPLVRFAQNDKGGCLMCGFTPKLAAEIIRAREQG